MDLGAVQTFLFDSDLEKKWLIRHPSVAVSIVGIYFVFVVWIGPAIMSNRKPFNLKNTIIVYNFSQAAFCAFFSIELIKAVIENWDSRCMVKNNPDLPQLLQKSSQLMWMFYLLKFVDLLDTVFFVLRKKQNQITVLHVFHHTVMCLIATWCTSNLNFAVGFFIPIAAALNTVIHSIMYTYYGLSAIGPHMQKYLWWKKYLTILQIFQAFIIMLYMTVGFVSGCEAVSTTEVTFFVYVAINFVLFINFYKKSKRA